MVDLYGFIFGFMYIFEYLIKVSPVFHQEKVGLYTTPTYTNINWFEPTKGWILTRQDGI